MGTDRFVLRHLASGLPWSDQDGLVEFASRADALFARGFMCEPAAFAVASSAPADDLLCEAS